MKTTNPPVKRSSALDAQRLAILRILYTTQISRVKLGKTLSLRLATITRIVRQLIQEELVLESKKKESSNKRGRKEVFLTLNPEGKFFLGCELSPQKIQILILNLTGEILFQESYPIHTKKNDAIVRQIADTVQYRTKLAHIPWDKIAGMGFVDPGVVDDTQGISIASSIFPEWRNVPVKKDLQQLLSIPVELIETSQAKALAEALFGNGKERESFAFIEYTEGIACGIVNEKQLLRGASAQAGELGHFQFPERNDPCKCGKIGCLEAISSIHAIEKRANVQMHNNHHTEQSFSFEQILEKADKGDQELNFIINEAILYLACAIANLIALLDPRLLILDRNFLSFGPQRYDALIQKIQKHLLHPESISIELSVFGEEIGSLGGAGLLLKGFFEEKNIPYPARTKRGV
ncbi:MAG: ROK family transcriptional regulator [Candidatus Ratteibacteria bacterium]|jgi:predicted NBD/HSP70 family sugar kinase